LKSLFAFLFGGGKNRLQGGISFRSPLRAESVGYFAVNHTASQRLLGFVVRRLGGSPRRELCDIAALERVGV